MRKWIVSGVVVLVLMLSSLSVRSSAQCLATGTGLAPPFGIGYFACVYQTYWLFWDCNFNLCPPAAGPTETRCYQCEKNQGSKPATNRPISLITGDTWIEDADVHVPGLSGGLALTRTWNSLWPPTQTASQLGIFGPNWRSTYEERIFVGSDNYVKYARSDGSFWSFGGAGTMFLIAPSNVTASLTVDSGYTQWTLAFQNGEKRIFSYTSGSLIAIVDRNGNTTQLSYNVVNQLTTVTDPVGRHLYFNYGTGSLASLVTSVTSDIGLTLSYSYDSQGRLIQVTKPDLTTISYQYDSNSKIASVLDSAGNLLESHTYDSEGRGLTSSRAGGAEAVTVTYSNP